MVSKKSHKSQCKDEDLKSLIIYHSKEGNGEDNHHNTLSKILSKNIANHLRSLDSTRVIDDFNIIAAKDIKGEIHHPHIEVFLTSKTDKHNDSKRCVGEKTNENRKRN